MAEPQQSTSPGAHGCAERVTWLELFYDLVFVAAVVTFSDAVSREGDADTVILVSGAFAAVWWIWLTTNLFKNRFALDDITQRVIVVVQMLLLTLMALVVGDGVDDKQNVVALIYALLCIDVAVMHARVTRVDGPRGTLAATRRNQFAVAAVPLLFAFAFDGVVRAVMWAIALAIIVLPGLSYRLGRRSGEAPINEGHLVERFGLLTIIVLGESFVKVSLIAADGSFESLDLFVLGTLFALVFAVWWAYFDDVPNAGLPPQTGRLTGWFVGHLLLQIFVVGIAVGYAKLLPLDLGSTVDNTKVAFTFGPLVGVYLSLALLGVCGQRTPRGPLLALRLVTAAAFAGFGALLWHADWVSVDAASVVIAVVALAHSAVAAALRRHTSTLVA